MDQLRALGRSARSKVFPLHQGHSQASGGCIQSDSRPRCTPADDENVKRVGNTAPLERRDLVAATGGFLCQLCMGQEERRDTESLVS